MTAKNLHALRVVLQQLGVRPTPSYRIVVYGDSYAPRHSDFNDPQVLIEKLRLAIPALDVSHLSMNPLGEGQGSIVLADGMCLDEQQLAILGLE